MGVFIVLLDDVPDVVDALEAVFEELVKPLEGQGVAGGGGFRALPPAPRQCMRGVQLNLPIGCARYGARAAAQVGG